MSAAKHAKAAQSQKTLAQVKIENDKMAYLQSPSDSNVTTLVVDYYQNHEMPHLGGEHPVDMYYLSSI